MRHTRYTEEDARRAVKDDDERVLTYNAPLDIGGRVDFAVAVEQPPEWTWDYVEDRFGPLAHSMSIGYTPKPGHRWGPKPNLSERDKEKLARNSLYGAATVSPITIPGETPSGHSTRSSLSINIDRETAEALKSVDVDADEIVKELEEES